MKQKVKPCYNPKFRQWEISWKEPDGSYGDVWGNTKEEAIERFKKSNTNDYDKG